MGPKRGSKRGFSIIEAMLAFVVLLIAITGFFVATSSSTTGIGMVPYSFRNLNLSADDVQAYALAQQYMDNLRGAIELQQAGSPAGPPLPGPTTAPIDAGHSFLGGTINTSPGNFTLTNNGCPATPASSFIRDCIVTVAWDEPPQTNKSITLESYVAY